MAFKKLFVVAACTWSALGLALNSRAPNPFVTGNLEDLPPACRTTCDTILGQFANVTTTTFPALCTTAATSSFVQCIDCVRTNAPEFFTSDVTTEIQTAVESLETGCLALGSPITSIVIPSATGGSGPTSSTGSFSILPLPSSSGTSTLSTIPTVLIPSQTANPSSTTSTSGSLGRSADIINLGVYGVIVTIGMALLV